MKILSHPLKNQVRQWIESLEDLEPQDKTDILEWLQKEASSFFDGKTLESVQDWMPDNLLPRLQEMRANESFSKAAGVPDESDIQDAIHWAESLNSFCGSEKQKAWASNLALPMATSIALAWKKGKTVPASAKWWIDNRQNLSVALLSL
jgi:hypothetical protein